MKRYICVLAGILIIAALILTGCGSSGGSVNNSTGTNNSETTSSTTYTGKVIVITYSATIYDQSSLSMFDGPPKEGDTYIVVNLNIENHGYDIFTVSNYFFNLMIGSKKYTDSYVYEVPDKMGGGDLHDGETIKGNIVYEVPMGTTDFTMVYKYASDFNIQWIKK